MALARNAIPVWGFFGRGWSPATTLVVYWFETLVGTLLIALRMEIHRHLTHFRGYSVEEAPAKIMVSSSGGVSKQVNLGYVPGFLVGALGFILAHGVFLLLLIAVVLPETADGGTVDREALRQGVLGTSGFLALGFLVDLVGLRRRPFAWIRSMAEGTFSRIVIVHMTIIIGMIAAMLFHRARPLFTVFVGLKLLADISAHVPQWRPKQAPAWMSRHLNPGGKGKPGGEDFASYWQRTEASEQEREAEDETVEKA